MDTVVVVIAECNSLIFGGTWSLSTLPYLALFVLSSFAVSLFHSKLKEISTYNQGQMGPVDPAREKFRSGRPKF